MSKQTIVINEDIIGPDPEAEDRYSRDRSRVRVSVTDAGVYVDTLHNEYIPHADFDRLMDAVQRARLVLAQRQDPAEREQ